MTISPSAMSRAAEELFSVVDIADGLSDSLRRRSIGRKEALDRQAGYRHVDSRSEDGCRGYEGQSACGRLNDQGNGYPREWHRSWHPVGPGPRRAFEKAAPLAGWKLCQAFATLQRLMEACLHKVGRPEYVQVLRLLESFELEEVHAAVRTAFQMGAISFDAMKHVVLCRVERRPPRLDLDVYPYLPRANGATTGPASYLCLTAGAST